MCVWYSFWFMVLKSFVRYVILVSNKDYFLIWFVIKILSLHVFFCYCRWKEHLNLNSLPLKSISMLILINYLFQDLDLSCKLVSWYVMFYYHLYFLRGSMTVFSSLRHFPVMDKLSIGLIINCNKIHFLLYYTEIYFFLVYFKTDIDMHSMYDLLFHYEALIILFLCCLIFDILFQCQFCHQSRCQN